MLIRPAVVADRADVDETDLQRIGSAGAQADPQTDGGAQQFVQRTYLHEFELHFVVCGQGQCKLLTKRTTKQKIVACGSSYRNGKPAGAAAGCDLFSAGTNAVQVSGFTLSVGALRCNETLAPRRSQ